MWNTNDCIKFAAKVLIYINILVGLLFVGYGLYVVFLPWGDTESYQALGICLTLFGVAFTCGSMFGYIAVDYQLKRFGGGWTGRSAIVFYDFLLLVLLAALVLLYIYGNQWLSDVKSAVDELYANPASSPGYSTPEKVIRDHFNKLFFTASDSCRNEYTWFWAFIDDICPRTMSRANCQGCGYSTTFCIADEYTCYEGTAAPPNQSFACPYVLCREGYLRWLNRTANKYFHPIVYACWAITIAIILLSLFLICYNQTKRLVIKAIESPEIDSVAFSGTNPAIVTRQVVVQPAAATAPRANLEVTTTSESANTDTVVSPTIATPPAAAVPPEEKERVVSSNPPVTTVELPPVLTMSNNSIDLDTENAIIDSFIAMSRDDGPNPGTAPSNHVHREHRERHSHVVHNTSNRQQSTESYTVSRASRQESVHVSSHGNGAARPDSYSYDAYEETYQRGSRRSQSHAQSRDYEQQQQRVVERLPRHGYNHSHQYQQHEAHTNEDVELEIAILESIESTQHGHQSYARHTQQVHSTHRSPRAHSSHTTYQSQQAERSQRQYASPHDQMYQPFPVSPGGADVELEIAMMESLAARSREDADVERALLESVQPRKKPLGIPTQLGAAPINNNRSVPRYETGPSTDSELDQAIIQSMLNKK